LSLKLNKIISKIEIFEIFIFGNFLVIKNHYIKPWDRNRKDDYENIFKSHILDLQAQTPVVG